MSSPPERRDPARPRTGAGYRTEGDPPRIVEDPAGNAPATRSGSSTGILDPDATVVPATRYSVDELASLFTRGFEGYLVRIAMTPRGLSDMIRSDSIDLSASRVLVRGGEEHGFILVGTRGWTRRVSAMGVVAGGRGRGLGRLLMETVIDEAAAAGYRRFVLEVIEKNLSARTLYDHLGFRRTKRLVGYERPAHDADEDVAGAPADGASLKPVDPRELAKIVEYEAPPDIPWQLAAETVAAAGPPAIALRLEDRAYTLITELTDDHATLGTLIVPHALRRQGSGLRMMQALFAHFPGREWRVPARFPENLAPGFFDRCGFRTLPLAQIEMERDLKA